MPLIEEYMWSEDYQDYILVGRHWEPEETAGAADERDQADQAGEKIKQTFD